MKIYINQHFHLEVDATVGKIVIYGQFPIEPYPQNWFSIDVWRLSNVVVIYKHIYIVDICFYSDINLHYWQHYRLWSTPGDSPWNYASSGPHNVRWWWSYDDFMQKQIVLLFIRQNLHPCRNTNITKSSVACLNSHICRVFDLFLKIHITLDYQGFQAIWLSDLVSTRPGDHVSFNISWFSSRWRWFRDLVRFLFSSNFVFSM